MRRKPWAATTILLALGLSSFAVCWGADAGSAGVPASGPDTAAALHARSTEAAAFRKTLAEKVAAAEAADQRAIRGADGWLFFRGALRSAAVGAFWGPEAAAVSRASRKTYADPLPAILEFNDQLKRVGVDLLVVPVPVKAFVYPEKLSAAVKPGPDGAPPRLDVRHQAFYRLLEDRGVHVLDLWPTLAAHRFDKEGTAYCKQDTHWSSRSCHRAAAMIADRYRDAPWFKDLSRTTFETEAKEVRITGDLRAYLKDPALADETLPMVFTGIRRDGVLVAPRPDRTSPVVLIGDSHTLVFSVGGDLHTRGAGLPDHLAAAFGVRIDLVGVRGSGVTVPRIDLARRRDNLKGKKLVVWCFSARQFTESTNGWMTGIPVVRPADP